MTTRSASHEFPGAFAYEHAEIPAELTIRACWRLDAQRRRRRRRLRALWRQSRRDYRLIVTEHRTRGLVDNDGTTYVSPPESEQEARSLIALLAGVTAAPAGGGPWRQPVTGGQRIIELERQR